MFDDFVVGFNQAAERFAMIDAGELKEGSDHKMRGTLVVPAPPDRARHTDIDTDRDRKLI